MTSSGSGFGAHRSAQARAWLQLSYRERLAWLEQAKRFARLALGAADRAPAPLVAAPGASPPPGTEPPPASS